MDNQNTLLLLVGPTSSCMPSSFHLLHLTNSISYHFYHYYFGKDISNHLEESLCMVWSVPHWMEMNSLIRHLPKIKLISVNPHIFRALSNLDGDSNVPEEELGVVIAYIHEQIAWSMPSVLGHQLHSFMSVSSCFGSILIGCWSKALFLADAQAY